MKEQDFKDYFFKYNREAYIEYKDEKPPPFYWMPDHNALHVYFGPGVDYTTRRPIIDNQGHRFMVTPNFTGTCAEFPWHRVANHEFAQAVKREQGQQPYYGMSVVSCSCLCREEGKQYGEL